MTAPILLAIAVIAIALGLLVFRMIPTLRAYFTYRGTRLVTCPENHKTVTVDVAARKAAVNAFLGDEQLRLDRCSRWPEHADCGQECLQQVEIDPENCLVWNIVSDWYEGKNCAICHKHFGAMKHLDHPPALMTPDHVTKEWKDFRPENLPEVFTTHSPVCWDCHIAESFRREHPELVVYRGRSA
jgi:hypothetical protein